MKSNQLQQSKYNESIKQLLNTLPLQYMLTHLSENPNSGSIFVDDIDRPSACVVVIKHLVFLGGQPSDQVVSWLKESIRPVSYFIYPDYQWKTTLLDLFGESLQEYQRSCFVKKPFYISTDYKTLNIVEIDAALMGSGLKHLDVIEEEIISTGTYKDLNDFYNRGIGFAPIIEHKIGGFCTSEYPSKQALAIGIEVFEKFQNRGYAKAMTQMFLNKAASKNYTVYWECWKNNIASYKTAESCGFEKLYDYSILLMK